MRGRMMNSAVHHFPFRNTPRASLLITRVSSPDRYKWLDSEFSRVYLIDEPWGPIKIYQDAKNNAQFTGVVCLKKSDDQEQTSLKTNVLEVFVAGDTAVNLYSVLNDRSLDRPMIHDVMANILSTVQMEDPRHWGLLRVAIVSLEKDVFIGRMFFGDQTTGKVYFDCDVRPSDGIFLALKQKAPIFVNENVWAEASKTLSKSTVHQMMSQCETSGPEGMASPQQGDEQANQRPKQRLLSPADFTELLEDDLDAIKLLKRKLLVAIKEEDYSAAASIRDHPYLIVYRDICQSKISGQVDRATKLEEELKRQVENNILRSEPKREGLRGKLGAFLRID